MQYRITSRSGQDMGIWTGETEAHALLALHRDAGYGPDRVWIESGFLVCDTAETLTTIGGVDDWVIEEVDNLLSSLTAELREIDRELAPGSETHVWGVYLDRIHDVMGLHASDESANKVIVPSGEADWWRQAYAILRANPAWTMDEIRDAVGTDRAVTCPKCGKANKLAHEDGAVDGPREYHAACWTAMTADEQDRAWEDREGTMSSHEA